MRKSILFAAGFLGLVACMSAVAADHVVLARNGPGGRNFSPATLDIAVGDTVTFKNDPADPGFHNARSDDGAITQFRCANGCDGDGAGGDGAPSSALWSATVTFPTAGTIGFHCEIHGSNGGGGMSGTITVVAGGDAPSISGDPTSISATAAVGGTASTAFAIANGGTAALDWTVDSASDSCAAVDPVSWILLDPVSGSVDVGAAADIVNVTLDASALAAGVYDADICVHSNDAANDPLSLPVEFTVTPADAIFADGFDG